MASLSCSTYFPKRRPPAIDGGFYRARACWNLTSAPGRSSANEDMFGTLLLSAAMFGSCPTSSRIDCAVSEEVLDRAEPVAVAPIAPPGPGESPARGVFRARATAVVAVMAPDGQGSGTILRP